MVMPGEASAPAERADSDPAGKNPAASRRRRRKRAAAQFRRCSPAEREAEWVTWRKVGV